MAARRSAGRSPARRWFGLVGAALLALAWFVWLRPTTLGGSQSYVVVDGSSMEPTYHDGDLVIVREEDRYAIGDIVAFRAGGPFDDPTRIIHRIVGETGDGSYRTRGDNRDRDDPWVPADEDVIGRAVFHAPRVGSLASAAGRPPVLAALGGAAVILGRNRRRRRPTPPALSDTAVPPNAAEGKTETAVVQPGTARWRRHTEPRWAFVGLLVSVAASLPVLLGTWSSIQASTTALRTELVGEIRHEVLLDYRFLGDPSAVYPTGIVATREGVGETKVPAEPLYSRVLKQLELAVEFRAGTTSVEDFASSYAVDVVVSMPEGWSRPVVTVPQTTFDGVANEVVVADLVDISAQVAEVAALTGVGGETYTIIVTPRLVVDGTSGGTSASDSVTAPLTFSVSGGVITAEPATNATARKELLRQVPEPTRFRIGLLDLETPTARGLLGGLALVTLAAAGWFASVLFGGVGLNEADRIAVRYRTQLIDVSSATGPPGPVVMVGSISELARLARVDQSVILHEDLGDGAHRYRVFLGAVTYEYESAPDHGGAAMSEAASPERPPG